MGGGRLKNPALCEHCSEIDFELFRLPTEAELQTAIAGRQPKRPPYHIPVEDFGGHLAWSMGLLSRIGKSAATCPLCSAVHHFCVDREDVRAMLEIEEIGDPWIKFIFISGTGRFDAGRPCSLFTAGLVSSPPPAEKEPLGPGRLRRPHNGLQQARVVDCFRVQEEERKPGEPEPPYSPGRFGSRPRPARVAISTLSNWLEKCLHEHGDSCSEGKLDGIARAPLIRLIDVHTESIVEIDATQVKQTPYVALSYVWGGPQRLVLLNGNRLDLMKPGALGPGKPARTIEDSMKLTKQLGYRYLWADALCILQDDLFDKSQQIGNMSNIYIDALFTIVAACGINAEGGLFGLWEDRSLRQDSVSVLLPTNTGEGDDKITAESEPGMTLLAMVKPRIEAPPPNNHLLSITRWHTRGWTTQERALSRRCIIFTEWEVYWSCGTLSRSEESGSDVDVAPRLSLFALDEANFELTSKRRAFYVTDDPSKQLWYKLRMMALDFSNRNLTEQGDAHDAFSSILVQLGNLTGEQFLWAHPAKRFAMSLCWEPLRRPVRRREVLTTLPQTSLNIQVPFPSWSWMGWMGQIIVKVEPSLTEDGYTPLTSPYVLRNNPSRLIPVSQISADNASPITVTPSSSSSSSSSSSHVTIQDIIDTHPGLAHPYLTYVPDDQLIVFRAEVCRFRITKPIDWGLTWINSSTARNKSEHGSQHRRDVLGERETPDSPKRKVVGSIARCFGPGEAGGIEDDDGDDDEKRWAEFVLLARSCAFEGADAQMVCLQVRDNGEGRGVMTRVNIAEIGEEAWRAAGPVRKVVVMN